MVKIIKKIFKDINCIGKKKGNKGKKRGKGKNNTIQC